MNLALIDTKVLQLINQYSINGNLTPSTSNQDYLLRTRNLIDACQKELADKFHIVTETEIVQVGATNATDFVSYPLPAKCESIVNIYLRKYPSYSAIPYIVQGDNILINPTFDGTLVINYNKIPNDITIDSQSSDELEIGIKYQELIPYYVGGWIYLEDNRTISTMLLNEYETKKNSLTYVQPTSAIQIENIFEGLM